MSDEKMMLTLEDVTSLARRSVSQEAALNLVLYFAQQAVSEVAALRAELATEKARVEVWAKHADASAEKARGLNEERMSLELKLSASKAENERLRGVIKEGLVFSGAWLDGNTIGWDSWNDRASRAVEGSSYWLKVEAERDALAELVKGFEAEIDLANKAAEMHRRNFETTKTLLNETMEVEADLRAELSAAKVEVAGLMGPPTEREKTMHAIGVVDGLAASKAENERLTLDRDAKSARMWELGKECDALAELVKGCEALLRRWVDQTKFYHATISSELLADTQDAIGEGK